jgi:hypothetical protein
LKFKNIFKIISVAAFINGCNGIPNDPLPDLFPGSVNAILMTGKQSQQVFFDRILPLGEPLNIPRREPFSYQDSCNVFIPGAEVSINGQKMNEKIGLDCTEQYYEIMKPGFIRSNQSYTLHIQKDGYDISGSTVVPDSFSIISHPKLLLVEKYTGSKEIKLIWQKSKNAKGYIYQINYNPLIDIFNNDTTYIPRFFMLTFTLDTTANINLYRDNTIYGSYNSCTIKVGAYDENFDKYYIKKHQSVGLTGAFGVFCSMVVDSIVIKVKEK